jgi:UDP-N-acetylmuramyl tripeptide synthase
MDRLWEGRPPVGGTPRNAPSSPDRGNYTGRVRLALEITLARLAGRLSRVARRGGGTTLPGKLLAAVDPHALTRLAGELPLGSALVSATNGKTTTAAMVAEILAPRIRLAHNRAGANLVSGVTSTLLEARDADLGLFEVDEGAFPDVALRVRPRAVCLGNLFRDQLDRYGELELVAERWRSAVAELDPEAWMVVNADDPLVAELARGRPNALRFGLDDPSAARERLPHAADSKYCLACGTPYDYTAAYVGHLGAYRCPSCGNERPPLDLTARSIALVGLERSTFELVTPQGSRSVSLALPGLYNVYNALSAAALALVLGAGLDEVEAGLHRFRAAFGRFERIVVGDRSLIMLLVKNPAGANEVVRTLVSGAPPRVVGLALNDAIADGRDVSWIWDVDFEPLATGVDRIVATGARAHELALRFKYDGLASDRIEVVPDLAGALDRGLALVPPGGELPVLPTYTAMLGLRGIAADRGLVRPYWEAAA